MMIFLDVLNVLINFISFLWCSLFMILILCMMLFCDELLLVVLNWMCLVVNVVFEECFVIFFIILNFFLFDEKLDFRCYGIKKIMCSWLCYILFNYKCVRK